MASMKLKIENSWRTNRSQQGNKFGHLDLWQASQEKFKIHGTPANAKRGLNWDTRTCGKHQTENIKISGTPSYPSRGINWDIGTYGKH